MTLDSEREAANSERASNFPPLPDWGQAKVVIEPPGEGEGNWVGGANALLHDGLIYLVYRIRRPLAQGRGNSVFAARSEDGVSFQTVAEIPKSKMDAESLERAALAVTPEGKWRLYLSCATTSTKHWRIEMLEAGTPGALAESERQVVLPGSVGVAVKDPVIFYKNRQWEMWVTCHPLDRGDDEADRMYSARTTSTDGVRWTELKTVLTPRPGQWDSRGARITSVLYDGDTPTAAYYDGRASADENFEERTGLALWDEKKERFSQTDHGPTGTPYGGLRYLTVAEMPGGGRRLYFEGRRADGAHELRTEVITAP